MVLGSSLGPRAILGFSNNQCTVGICTSKTSITSSNISTNTATARLLDRFSISARDQNLTPGLVDISLFSVLTFDMLN